MKIVDNLYLAKAYRNYRLKKGTPDIIRTMYVERKGNFQDLLNKYGQDIVEQKLYLGQIAEKNDGNWDLTRNGKEEISIFHIRQTPFQCVKSILFVSLAKLF